VVLTRFSVPALLVASLVSPAIAASESTAFEFSTCGASGRTGPSQTQCNNAYQGTSLENRVEVVGEGIQEWSPPETDLYNVTCAGAKGGDDGRSQGGRGAVISAEIELNGSKTYRILVGQEGGYAENTRGVAGAGGGGTFIVRKSDQQPIMVCGGGGGVSYIIDPEAFEVSTKKGLDASFTESGRDGTENPDSWNPVGQGGSNGNGGEKIKYSGGGGGGLLSDGSGISGDGKAYAGEGGESFLNGGAGGINREFSGGFVEDKLGGGFGGGAGAAIHENYEVNAGGGGGYSGGGGGATRAGSGGGGGSFVLDKALNRTNIGYNTRDGYVEVNPSGPPKISICNFRGPRNQCVSNQTNFLSQSSFDVSSALLIKPSAVFQSSLPQPFINVSNSTRLSGEWRGGFEVSSSSSPVIGAGASFEPGEEDIVIGK
jgi:hypothetical protein